MSATWGAVVLCMGLFGTDPLHFPSSATIRRDELRGTVRWAEAVDLAAGLEDDPAVQAARKANDPGGLILAVLAARRQSLGLQAPPQELLVFAVEPDPLGGVRVRLRQQHHDVPIEGAELSAQIDAQQRFHLLSGRYVRTPTQTDVQPKLDAVTAIATAATAAGVAVRALHTPQTVIVWYPDDRGAVRLAYRVTVDVDLVRKEQIFVDAMNGALIARVPTSVSIGPGTGGIVGP